LTGFNVLLKLPSVLTHEQASDCSHSLNLAVQAASADQGPIIADASSMAVFDSSALAVLLDCRRQALAMGFAFWVQGLPPRLRQLAGLYGIASLIPSSA